MRRFLTTALAIVVFASVALVAQRARTAEDMDKLMKKIGSAQQALNKSIQSLNYGEAKKQIEIMDEGIRGGQNFWVLNKKDDAVKFSKDTTEKIEALDRLLEAKRDAAALTAAYREVSAACATCHRAYRATDENNQFIIKPGSVS